MNNKTKNIIIIVLVCAIVAAGAVLGYLLYQDKAKSNSASSASVSEEQTTKLSEEVFEGILNQQMMFVNGIHYYYKSSSEQLKHDAMGASVFNNSEVSIKSFKVAFCAFDENGNPIKIVQPEEQTEGGYVRAVTYDYSKAQGEKTSLEPGETCKDILMYVKSEPQIVTVKACVKSYISTDDVTWENPYYKTFLDMYGGKKL